MSSTAANILSRPDAAGVPLAAELRYVTVATHRRPRHQRILDNVSTAIHPGEVLAVLSRHDTAATTFLDLLDGRLSPTWGWVQVAGQEITRLAALAAAARELGAAVVLATRDSITASRTDRVLLLRRGKVVDDTAAA